ncbi:MAG: alkaline phosphatase PafA [bacterium]
MRLFFVMLTCLVFGCSLAQEAASTNPDYERPKLVVGIVVDQMRYDYLTRFEAHFGEGGFKRLINEGFNCKNNHYDYIPTYTGPGHASVFTGTSPKNHGIIANNWYDKEVGLSVYCAGDPSMESVGTESSAGRMSPHRMLTTTFADENRLFTQQRGKSIGISVKDRGAILPAGHSANAAYWFYGKKEGNFISSSYYMNELPQWVKEFNESDIVENYLKTWDTYKDIATYLESGSDENAYERGFKGKETATFPYELATLKEENGYFDILRATPYGNSMVTDFALAALEGEALGEDAITDVLTVSYSSTDYIGHNFGVNSKEIQDTYIRLDLELKRLLETLDAKVGKGAYTVFLTADHGAVDVPAYLQSQKIPAGYLNNNDRKNLFRKFLQKTYGSSNLIADISNNQIFLNYKELDSLGLNLKDVQDAIVHEQIRYPNVDKVYSAYTMSTTEFTSGIEVLLQNGYNQRRSGDILIVDNPAYITYSRTGSTHGSGLNYDTHVPLLFYGNGIQQGSTLKKTAITDIAPTISALLGISFPNGATGDVLDYVIKTD